MKKIIRYILFACFRFLRDDFTIRMETSPFTSEQAKKILERDGFVLKGECYERGFIFVRIFNDCIEIKTVSTAGKVIYISLDEKVLLGYLAWLRLSKY